MRGQGSFRATAIAFTYNNPPEEAEVFLTKIKDTGADYVVFQLEQGEQGNTQHYQGYAHYPAQRRFGPRFRGLFAGTLWCRAARGNPAQNRVYCTKADTRVDGPWEHGSVPTGQGARTDIADVRDQVKAGATLQQLHDAHPDVMAKYPVYAASVRQAFFVPARIPTKVILLVGEPRLGKTTYAEDECRRRFGEYGWWINPVGDKLEFDGLEAQHQGVVLDEFSGRYSKTGLSQLLRLLDGRSLCVRRLYGYAIWNPRVVFITTNYMPQAWYDWSTRLPSWKALRDRFSEVRLFRRGRPVHIMVRTDVSSNAQHFMEFWREPVPSDYIVGAEPPAYPEFPVYGDRISCVCEGGW